AWRGRGAATAAGGLEQAHQGVANPPAGHMQVVDAITVLAQAIEDVAIAEGDGNGAGIVEPGDCIERAVEGETADYAARLRIGQWRTVAVEVRQDMQILSEGRTFLVPQFGDTGEDNVMGAAVEGPSFGRPL